MASRSGCLKTTLFGCLGIIVLLIILAAAAGIMASRGMERAQVADQELLAADAAEMPQPAALARHAGRVVVDLAQGEFYLKPGEPGSGVRVKARFDQSSYRLEDSLEVLPDSTWVYTVTYRRTTSGLVALARAIMGEDQVSRVEVYLPPDVPVVLDLDIAQGGAEVELGGLWLTEAEINYSQGGFELSFSEPLREPMERLVVAGNMGGFEADRLGNASPSFLAVECRMGGGEIDLRGQWLNSADVMLEVSMGGMAVLVPDHMPVNGYDLLEQARPLSGGDPEVPTPELNISVDQSMGEIEIIRR